MEIKMNRPHHRPVASGRFWAVFPLLLGCGVAPVSAGAPVSMAQGVAIVCLDPAATLPADASICGRPQTFECGASNPTVFVQAPTLSFCAAARLVVSPTALTLGANLVVVRDDSVTPARTVCSSEVTVVDRRAPEVSGRVIPLWPPNHRMETLRAADCVTVRDACDEAPRAVFTWAQVDEPDDATGDGHTADDVRFDGCEAVALRAERRGNGDGRVYSLGVRVTDRSGNVTDAVCQVVVTHDQSGRAAAVGSPTRRVAAPAGCR
jgi:hypothetical protein